MTTATAEVHLTGRPDDVAAIVAFLNGTTRPGDVFTLAGQTDPARIDRAHPDVQVRATAVLTRARAPRSREEARAA